jgi:SAM-dependent methyltransferase
MDRRRISALAHGDHPVAAPLGDGSVARLLDRAMPRDGEGRVLDLGCGEAPWLIRALEGRPGLRADGVDNDAATVARTRKDIAARGLGDRITLYTEDAAEFAVDRPYDLVLCVGSTHAFGGLRPTLDAVAHHLAPGGCAIVGEGFWERPPDARTLAAGFTPDEYADLAGTTDTISTAGWTPVYAHVSTLGEWDDYEWSWTGTLARWALDNPSDPDSGEAYRAAAEHRTAWLHGYRGTLGFATFLLRRTPGYVL